MEWPSESTLRSHRAVYEAAKQGGSGKTYKRAQATLLETLKFHGLEGEYCYITGGEKGPPPNKSETVPMEVYGEGETAVSQGGGDAPWGANRSPGRSKSRQKRSEGPKTTLGGNCLCHHHEAQCLLLYLLWPPPTSDDGFIRVQ